MGFLIHEVVLILVRFCFGFHLMGYFRVRVRLIIRVLVVILIFRVRFGGWLGFRGIRIRFFLWLANFG